MVPFHELPYRRPDMAEIGAAMRRGCEKLENAKTFEDAYYALLELEAPRRLFMTLAVQCEARNTMDTTDEFFIREAAFFDAARPEMTALETRMRTAMTRSPFRPQLEKQMGAEPFARAEVLAQSFVPGLEGELEKENELSARYSSLTAALRVEYEGEQHTLAAISRLMNPADRDSRRQFGALAETAWAGIADELDGLYEQLVAQRARIAGKLGCADFVEVGYRRMGRTCITPQRMQAFRQEVRQHLVPVVHKLYKQQGARLGYNPVYHFDEDTDFDAPADHLGEDVAAMFAPVFSALSPETDVFYKDLLRGRYYDTALRPGKIMGAYSNTLPVYGMPFVFLSYNQTPGALRTYAHECGHALHSYLNRGEAFLDTGDTSSELAEVHSMSMEFFVWPHLAPLFEDGAAFHRYCYQHMKRALAFIPYGCAVDEFQHAVYADPALGPEGRLALWRRLEQQYLPWRAYPEEGEFYAEGRFWQRQTHIYKWPFYYIDYVLAQVCALQFHMSATQNRPAALDAYMRLLRQSGRFSLEEAMQKAGLPSPFAGGCMESLAAWAQGQLDEMMPLCAP